MYIRHHLGREAEKGARNYLEAHGLDFIEANFQCRMGEIDIIMRDQNVLVFVEVRLRTHHHFVNGLESITAFKQRKIIKTALYYLQKRAGFGKVPVRFDVVGVTREQDAFHYHWIEDAFRGRGF